MKLNYISKIGIFVLIVILLCLSSWYRTRATTFDEIISNEIEYKDLDNISIYFFKYGSEGSSEVLQSKFLKEEEKINEVVDYLNTFLLMETKDKDSDMKKYDTKLVMVFDYVNNIQEDKCSIEITSVDYENLQIIFELSNNKVIKKNYKILDHTLDKNFFVEDE